MFILKEGKTNWMYIFVVVVLAAVVGGGILWWVNKQEISPTEFFQIPKKVEKIEDETVNWETYRNEEHGFEVRYPEMGDLVDSNMTDDGIRINLPFDSGTLLQEKYLNVKIDPKEIDPEGECSLPLPNVSKIEEVWFGNISFLKKVGEEGAAGSIYYYTSYSTASDLHCVILTFILRSANPGVFDSPPPDFDKEKEVKVFDQIVSTCQLFIPEGVNLP